MLCRARPDTADATHLPDPAVESDRSVILEEVDGLVIVALVDVVPIGVLEVTDSGDVLEDADSVGLVLDKLLELSDVR